MTKKSCWIELRLLTGSELRMPTRSIFCLSRLFVLLFVCRPLFIASSSHPISLLVSFVCPIFLSIHLSVFLSFIHIALSFFLTLYQSLRNLLSIVDSHSAVKNLSLHFSAFSSKVFLQCFCHSTYYFCICHISDFRYFNPELTSSISDLFLNG